MTETVPNLQVLIAVAGGPNLLEAQLSAIDRFFPVSAQVLVVDDSRRRGHYSNNQEQGSSKRLREVAEAHGAQYVRLPQYLHFMRQRLFPNPHRKLSTGPSLRTADAVQYGLSFLGSNIQQLVILDSDMIPIVEFIPESYFAEAIVWFLPQERSGPNGEIVYPWPGIFFADLTKADVTSFMNWDCAVIDGVALDTGGEMRPWMEANALQAKQITGLHSGKWKWEKDFASIPLCLEQFLTFDARQNNEMQFCELFLGTFLHLRAGSNWEPAKRDSFQERMNLFTDGIKVLVTE